MIKENQMLFLSMHDLNDGRKTFIVEQDMIWFIIKKCFMKERTEIIDIEGKEIILNLNNFKWLPNRDFIRIKNLLAKDNEEKLKVLKQTSFRASLDLSEKGRVSETYSESNGFIYPAVYTTPKTGPRFFYCKVNSEKINFNILKVVFRETGINEPIIDFEGKYGMTDHTIGIKVNSKDEAEKLFLFHIPN